MTERHYSSIAGSYTLTASVSDASTSIKLSGSAGLPTQYPFTLVLDPGTVSEEIVTVTALSGVDATVVRGEDGSSAVAHNTGAVVRHMATGRDFREPQQHIDANSGVHGVSSRVVGTTDPQTIQNKTFDTTNTFPSIAKSQLPSDTVYTNTPQTLAGKTMSGSTNTFVNIPKSALPSDIYYGTTTSLPASALSYYSATRAAKARGAVISWASSDVVTDAQGAWSASDPSRLTAKSAGAYLAIASYGKTISGVSMSGERSMQVFKNGTVVAGATTGSPGSTGAPVSAPLMVSVPLTLAAGDYVEMSADEGSAGGGMYFYSFSLLKIA